MSLLTNLISYYKCDENTGTTVGDSAGSNTGTTNGLSPWTSSGKINSGLSFNGSTNYVSVANDASLQITGAFTIQAWVNPTNLLSYGGILAKYTDDTHMEFQVRIEQTSGLARCFIGGDNTSSVTAVSTGVFTQIVFTHASSGGNLLCYLNGSLDATGLSKSGGVATTAPLIIGNRSAGGFDPFLGVIDEPAIWSRALSPTEVSQLYNGGAGLQYPFGLGGARKQHLTLLGIG